MRSVASDAERVVGYEAETRQLQFMADQAHETRPTITGRNHGRHVAAQRRPLPRRRLAYLRIDTSLST